MQDGLLWWWWKSVNDSSYQDILSLLTEAIIKSQTTAVSTLWSFLALFSPKITKMHADQQITQFQI